MARDHGFVMYCRKLARRHYGELRRQRDDIIQQIWSMPKPSPQRAALLDRLRTINSTLGEEQLA